MKLSLRRAELLAFLALVLHLLFFLLTLWIAGSSGSGAVRVEAWHFLGGAGIWVVLLLQFRQRRLAEEERLDAEAYKRLKQEGKDTSVFETTAVESSIYLAQRRLVWMEKYLLAIFAVLVAGVLVGAGYWQYVKIAATKELTLAATRETLLVSAAFLSGFALMSFLFSRYAVGMSQQPAWRPLRAGGSYLLSNGLACFALAILLMVADAGYPIAERIASYVLVVLMIAIGIEILLNLVLDIYRPRIPGRYRRAAYESRLLGLFSEPGGIFRTFAHAIDYQFGFKVSETWFYRLLQRAVLPLLVVQIIILYLMTCFDIVPAGFVGVLERWGQPVNIDNGQEAVLPSGLHVKCPWPIDRVRIFPLNQIQILNVGFEQGHDDLEGDSLKPRLWTVAHWQEEFPFLVAVRESRSKWAAAERKTSSAVPAESRTSEAPTAGEDKDKVAVGGGEEPGAAVVPISKQPKTRIDFNLLAIDLVIHYRIDDVIQYGYGKDFCYENPRQLLLSICYRAAIHFAANSDIDTLLGPGRHLTTETLKKRIQRQVDAHQMGIKIVFVGLMGVHPPVEVAQAYENVVAALQQKQAKVLNAQGESHAIKARAQGDENYLLSSANAYTYRREVVAQANAERFGSQILAFEKGRQVYCWREYLSVLDEFLSKMRKYVIVSEDVSSWVYEFDLKEKLQPDLFEGLGIDQSIEQEK